MRWARCEAISYRATRANRVQKMKRPDGLEASNVEYQTTGGHNTTSLCIASLSSAACGFAPSRSFGDLGLRLIVAVACRFRPEMNSCRCSFCSVPGMRHVDSAVNMACAYATVTRTGQQSYRVSSTRLVGPPPRSQVAGSESFVSGLDVMNSVFAMVNRPSTRGGYLKMPRDVSLAALPTPLEHRHHHRSSGQPDIPHYSIPTLIVSCNKGGGGFRTCRF